MADLIGIQIPQLTLAPSISLDTEFALQRVGQRKAEKSNFRVLNNLIINSEEFNIYLNTYTTSKITDHKGETDPHGDRAYANSLVSNHKSEVDPHKDREFTTTSIEVHKTSVDPHGDRAFTTAQIVEHSATTDPHGDRAYTDTTVASGITESKGYTDVEIKTKVTDSLGLSIAPLEGGKVPDEYLNKEIVRLPLSSFPPTGNIDILYLDTTNNDLYRWSGSEYKNLTPEVNIDNLTVTTDNVTEGTNPDRKYLTSALKTSYDNKVSTISNSVEPTSNHSLISSNVDTDVKLKTIKVDEGVYIKETIPELAISDRIYKYEGVSEVTRVDLTYSEQIKTNLLTNLNTNKVYNIFGDITCIAYEGTTVPYYVVDNEKIKVDSLVGLGADTEAIPKPTTLVINEEGTVVTGKGVPSKQVKIYNSSFVEISTSNVLSSGDFTASLSSAITDGSPLYVYSVDGVYRSKDVKLYTPNLTGVKDCTLISVNSTGLELKGKAERNSTITVSKATGEVLGTTTSDYKGFFSITLSEAIVDSQEVSIKTVTDLAVEKITSYTVILSELIAPYEVEVNDDRTLVKGKGEPESSIVATDGTNVFLIDVDSSGNFTKEISIPSDKTLLTLTIEKDSKEYDVKLLLNRYINENNKPKEQQKVLSSSFKVISLNKSYLDNKTDFDFDFTLTGNVLKISVKNNDNKTTKWVALLSIKEISL